METSPVADFTSVRETPAYFAATKLPATGPITCSGSGNTVQCRECVYLILRDLTIKILEDQHTVSRLEEGEIETVVIDKITPEKAKALVANNGHWSPEQTADRIFSFAVTITGKDRNKFDKTKASISDGFQSAGESFGGELPELTDKTLAVILSRLHAWVEDRGDIADL